MLAALIDERTDHITLRAIEANLRQVYIVAEIRLGAKGVRDLFKEFGEPLPAADSTKPDPTKHEIQVALNEALKPGGWVIMAAFAPDGPEKCSGLQIVQYDAAKLGKELGGKYRLERQEKEMHVTPAGQHQSFGFYCFRKMA